MNVWIRRITLIALAIVFSGMVTAYIEGGLLTAAVVFVALAVTYAVIPKRRLRVERTADPGRDE